MKIKFEWEYLDVRGSSGAYRAKVFGGWIVNCISEGWQTETSIFVPDPNHEWEIEK